MTGHMFICVWFRGQSLAFCVIKRVSPVPVRSVIKSKHMMGHLPFLSSQDGENLGCLKNSTE